MRKFIDISEEVSTALLKGKPVLALESTIITHGLPRPENLETALTLEGIARERGVTPATIAIMDGKIKIGLSAHELKHLANSTDVIKASCRDMAYALQRKFTAGTTVASTLYCANLAGIKIFATGGVGGVHRGDAQDISADLIELSRTPMAVICAGAKAILDLPRTLEFLETYSVPVIGYETNYMPAFYTAKTNYQLPMRADNAGFIAAMLKTHWELGMTSGVLIMNPIPIESEIAAEEIEPIIARAIQSAKQNIISGKGVTPYLLNEVLVATDGRSLPANIALVKNNVKLGAEIAKS